MNSLQICLLIGFVLSLIFIYFFPLRYSWGERNIAHDLFRAFTTPFFSAYYASAGFHFGVPKDLYWIVAIVSSIVYLSLISLVARVSVNFRSKGGK